MRPIEHTLFWGLSAIWGLSFFFMRLAAPELGVLWSAQLRVALAWVALIVVFSVARKPLAMGTRWPHFLLVGTLNSGVPFTLFSFAALHIPAGYSAILNAGVPLWAAIFAWPILGQRIARRVVLAVLIAAVGIGLMVRLGPVHFSREVLLAIAACVCATVCYGFAAVWSKRHLSEVPGYATATHGMMFAALALLPGAATQPWPTLALTKAWFAVLALALLCSALAYLLYFELFRRMSATRATSVTFVVPAFGLFWAWLFLGEPVTLTMLAGFALVLCATALVMQIGPFRMRQAASSAMP